MRFVASPFSWNILRTPNDLLIPTRSIRDNYWFVSLSPCKPAQTYQPRAHYFPPMMRGMTVGRSYRYSTRGVHIYSLCCCSRLYYLFNDFLEYDSTAYNSSSNFTPSLCNHHCTRPCRVPAHSNIPKRPAPFDPGASLRSIVRPPRSHLTKGIHLYLCPFRPLTLRLCNILP